MKGYLKFEANYDMFYPLVQLQLAIFLRSHPSEILHFLISFSDRRDAIVHASFNGSNPNDSDDEIDAEDDDSAEGHPHADDNDAADLTGFNSF